MYPSEIEWFRLDWTYLAHDRDQWRALVNIVMNLRVLQKTGKFLSGCTIDSFSRRAQLHKRGPAIRKRQRPAKRRESTLRGVKTALVDRFSEKLPARYHYNLLHEATQSKDESPIQFLDRCRALRAKTIRKSADPTEQRTLKEEADFRLLTSFIYCMKREAGRELRIRNPKTSDQALNIAIVVYNDKRVELRHKDYEALAVKTDGREDFANPKGYRPPLRQRDQPRKSPGRRTQERWEQKRDRVRPPITCFACGRHGHIARNYEARRKPTTEREQHSPN
ncbi:hypothetical protein B7P43_G14829 [Cryptotermes secundus]|uniref:CCHC-type domain-containing protein n=1 Tax=Cryptotermes secundus TaxID=105785 RepID=A0A2J7RM71_9NEOP|nr:hypothetical protein B7P43_G14829 [Cryptotermes secundus]